MSEEERGGLVLVTGSAGRLGTLVCEALDRRCMPHRDFDLVEGLDVSDLRALGEAAEGCGAIVHLAAVPTDVFGAEADVGRTNVLGTWNVAAVAEAHRVRRVVFSSSVNAVGLFMGQGLPASYPIPADVAPRPISPYSVSKLAGEELLGALSRRTPTESFCLRLPRLLAPGEGAALQARWLEGGIGVELSPYWEYGVYLDIRDAASAVVAALACELPESHVRVFVCDSVPAHVAPLSDLVAATTPGLVGEAEQALHDLGLLLDPGRAWSILGVEPQHRWNEVS